MPKLEALKWLGEAFAALCALRILIWFVMPVYRRHRDGSHWRTWS